VQPGQAQISPFQPTANTANRASLREQLTQPMEPKTRTNFNDGRHFLQTLATNQDIPIHCHTHLSKEWSVLMTRTRKRTRKILALLSVLLMTLVFSKAWAEPENSEDEVPADHTRGVKHARYHRGDMHADRPELTLSARTVAPGRVQLESELAVEREEGADENRVVLPSLLRVGVVQGLELRLESDLLVFEGAERGTSDLSVGVKWNLLDGDPTLGILADLVIPAGNEHFRSEGSIPSFRLMSDIPLGEGWEMRLNAGGTSIIEDGDRNFEAIFGVAVFAELAEGVEAHVEYGRMGAQRGERGRPIQVVDTGLAFKIDRDTHFDVAIFKGLDNEEGMDWRFSIGFAKRF
jgi:Putative MetA-pathway of phenol degradation